MKPAPLIGFAIILAALAFGARAFVTNLTPYVSFAEARKAGSENTLQVIGKLDKNSVSYGANDHALRFSIVSDEGQIMPVRFSKAKPPNFEEALQVTAIGRWDGRVFQADNLLVKCPTKYQGTETTKSYGADNNNAPAGPTRTLPPGLLDAAATGAVTEKKTPRP